MALAGLHYLYIKRKEMIKVTYNLRDRIKYYDDKRNLKSGLIVSMNAERVYVVSDEEKLLEKVLYKNILRKESMS
jgi:hypothetical protein